MTDSAAGSAAWRQAHVDYARQRPRPYCGVRRVSCYVAVRDGTRLAVDIHLPADAGDGARFPTIVNATPYVRRFRLAAEALADTEPSPNTAKYRDYFVPCGYAVVVVDVRGTGASFGTRYSFRSPVERDDFRDLIDWIVAQRWSNGNVGATGVSYVGATSDFIGSTGHPAVKAVCPTFSVWDTWSDHYYAGGLYGRKFAPAYAKVMLALDQDRRELYGAFDYLHPPAAFEGPAPVDEDTDGALLRAAIADHAANADHEDVMRQFAFRDTGLSYDPTYTGATISPYRYAAEIAPDCAYFSMSGWYDGNGFANGSIKRFRSIRVRHNHLLLGPWDHGARRQVSPDRNRPTPEFDLLAESLRFFDQHLAGMNTGLLGESRVHYFTMVEERWKEAANWPPAGFEARSIYLGPDHGLTARPPDAAQASDAYCADYACTTGVDTRYERLVAHHVETYYASWHGRDARMLTYDSAPFETDTELTGHPVADLFISCSERDAGLFVYLEDVAPDGTCRYITEGVLRLLHRKLAEPPWNDAAVGPYHSFARADAALLVPGDIVRVQMVLSPISWLIRRAHRVRVALAGCDTEHYARVPDGVRPRFELHRSATHPSRIELPLRAA